MLEQVGQGAYGIVCAAQAGDLRPKSFGKRRHGPMDRYVEIFSTNHYRLYTCIIYESYRLYKLYIYKSYRL